MKILAFLLIFYPIAFGQRPGTFKVITFDRTDIEHCKVITIAGRSLLESSYSGTSVAVSMPLNMGNGEFSVLVSISRTAPSSIEVVPQKFWALYSDPAHTRFPFYDKAAEIEMAGRTLATSGANFPIDTGMLRAPAPGGDPVSGPRGSAIPTHQPSAQVSQNVANPAGQLSRGILSQGDEQIGWVIFRKPRNVKIRIRPTDMVDEIDIPVNGFLFRF